MLIGTPSALFQLAKRALFEVPASAHTITCRAGTVWITQDSDPRDVILESGQSFTLDALRRTIVYGLDASTLSIDAPMEVAQQTAPREPALA